MSNQQTGMVEYEEPLYKHSLVEKAVQSDEPVSDIEFKDDNWKPVRVHVIRVIDGVAWRVMIKNYLQGDDDPSVKFSKSHFNSDVHVLRQWTTVANGRSGPDKLDSWSNLFEVFTVAKETYEEWLIENGYESEKL